MMDEDRRQKIIDEIQGRLGIEDVPAHAMTRKELKKVLGIGDVSLDNAFAEIDAEGRLNSAKTYRENIANHRYLVEVFWFDDEPNTLHSSGE